MTTRDAITAALATIPPGERAVWGIYTSPGKAAHTRIELRNAITHERKIVQQVRTAELISAIADAHEAMQAGRQQRNPKRKEQHHERTRATRAA